MTLTKPWDEHVIEHFRAHPEEVPGYLDACLDEGSGVFLAGLRHVIEATEGMSDTAAKAQVHRVSLYKMLGDKGNPTLSSLTQVLEALGLRLSVVQASPAEQQARRGHRKSRSAAAR